jgi:uncharacterized FAD-dependent dehydrogenase
MYDVVIIGAGPAGLFAAMHLGQNKKVIMIDAGRRIENKICSLHLTGRCTRCRPVCNILGGFGGAQFFLGTKLSRYPAGKALLGFVNDISELESLYDYVDQILECYGKSKRKHPSGEKITSLKCLCNKAGIDFKYYNAQKVSNSEMNHIGLKLHQRVIALGIHVHLMETVSDVRQIDGGFIVKTNMGHYIGKTVIFALGRVGGRMFESIATKLNVTTVEYGERKVELGVRIETPRGIFDDVDGVHNDLKLKRNVARNEEVKSFCQDYGGYLTTCCYNLGADPTISSLDGYIAGAGGRKGAESGTSNLGIHHQFVTGQSLEHVYQMLGSISRQGKPIVQSMRGFLDGGIGNDFAVTRTISDVYCDDINKYLPKPTLDYIKSFIRMCDQILPGLADGGNAVYAPSFELGTAKYCVDRHFQSNIRGVYIIGDCCGYFRGSMQAMVSGYIAARSILKAA